MERFTEITTFYAQFRTYKIVVKERITVQTDILISIVHTSNPDLLINCVRSIFTTTHNISFEVWIVDNATDGTGRHSVSAEFPQVKWLCNSKREGFSANHNQVLSRSTSRYSCIFNDDTLVHEGAFEELVKFMDTHTDVGMVGARLLNSDGSIQDCTFRFMTLFTELVGICSLPRRLCFLKTCGIDKAQFQNQVAYVDWVLGACIVVRDSALKQIGLLDEKLSPIIYSEETDWCYRAHKANWQVAYHPAAQITHYGGQSTKPSNSGVSKVQMELFRTRVALFRKHYGPLQAGLLRLIYTVTLPWNVLMLTQSVLRRQISPEEFKRHLQLVSRVAAMSALSRCRFSAN